MLSTTTDQIITVSHEHSEGWHTFTSEQVPGLFVTGRDEDLQGLYEAVPVVIAELAKVDFGRMVTVTPEHTFSSYMEEIRPTDIPPVRYYSIKSKAGR